jgi:glycosyltransferase involved in cell wall biosynthesis
MTGAGHDGARVDAEMRQLGIEDRVKRLPLIGFRDLLGYTVNADAGVLLYENNDLGNFFQAPGRLTEYLACGLPILATNHTGLENIVVKHDLGVSVDSTDAASVADGIVRLAARIGARELQHDRIRRVFLERFAFERWEPRIVAAFDALVTGRRGGNARPKYPWDVLDNSARLAPTQRVE